MTAISKEEKTKKSKAGGQKDAQFAETRARIGNNAKCDDDTLNSLLRTHKKESGNRDLEFRQCKAVDSVKTSSSSELDRRGMGGTGRKGGTALGRKHIFNSKSKGPI